MPTSKAINASSFFGKDRYEYYLNELLTENTVGGQKLSKEELKEGFSRRKNKISFEKFVDKIVSTKAAKAAISSPGKGPSPASGGRMNGPRGNALVRSPSSALQKYTGVSQKVGVGIEEDISAIAKYMSSIADTLALQKKVDDDESAYEKRKAEQEKRKLAENKLEKRFEGLKKLAEKIIAPVKSLLDKILQFFTTVILGRIVYRLVEWLGDEKNASKVKSLIRFLKDWGPALLGGFILFGTKFGKGVRILTKIALSGIAKLAKAIPSLLRFAKGNPKTALAIATGAYATTQLAQRAFSGGDEEPKAQGFVNGGVVNILKFSGGGLNSGGFGNFFNGFVSGEKGIDKVPAMLSDGEFVMSRGAVAKYGVDTLESMNAAGGGTNKPKIMSGTTYAQGGGYMGDYMKDQVKLRPATRYEMTGESQKLRDLLGVRSKEEAARIVSSAGNKVPDVRDLLGNAEFSRFEQGHFSPYSEGADEKTFRGLKRIYQQHFGVGEEFSKMVDNRSIIKMARRSSKPTSTPKPRITRIDPSRMLPAAGESSANAMRAAAKAATNVRAPIPATSAIVPYTGGGLARTGVTGGLSVPKIKTNMKVPGGFGNLKSLGVELLLSYLVQSGLDYVEAKRLASSIEKARKESPEKLSSRIEKLRELVDKEERYQKSLGGILDKVIRFGGETGSEILSRQAKTILSGLGAKTFQGGKIMGGYGLKEQSFKDAPKTQIMTDDKGRPFVGYKAMRGGKTVYVRGPQPGTGTSNPLESLGRMINPGAYKNIDAANARKKYDEASKGSISSLKARGATQATIAKRQAELNKRKPLSPPKKPSVIYTYPQSANKNKPSSIYNRPSTSNIPNFSASTRGSRSKQNTLGLAR